ncbi:hypothetical protein [Nocardioides endophyticus]|uniref:hypothetical protein n=1 Tax=Nocardioides endophyticus TaxID=1353775 RepID=UPI0031E8CC3C
MSGSTTASTHPHSAISPRCWAGDQVTVPLVVRRGMAELVGTAFLVADLAP